MNVKVNADSKDAGEGKKNEDQSGRGYYCGVPYSTVDVKDQKSGAVIGYTRLFFLA